MANISLGDLYWICDDNTNVVVATDGNTKYPFYEGPYWKLPHRYAKAQISYIQVEDDSLNIIVDGYGEGR